MPRNSRVTCVTIRPVSTDKSAVAAYVRRQRDGCAHLGSSLYAGLLDRVAREVEAGGPAWRVLEPFAGWPEGSAYVLRVMGAVNRLVLTGDAPELEPHFAPGGDPDAAWPALAALLEDRKDAIVQSALERPVQTNEVGRCAVLAPAMLWLSRGLPLRILELGASAGLNLRWDAYRYGDLWGDPGSSVRVETHCEGDPPPFAPAQIEIAERRGCDARPIDPTAPDGRLALLSYVWPDQRERVELLRAALDFAPTLPATVDAAPAADWLEQRLAETPRQGVATVVFHSIVWQYLDDEQRSRIQAALAEAGAKASEDAPLAWLRMEADNELTRVDATLWPGGESRLIARAGYHGRPVHWLAGDDREGSGERRGG